MAPKPQFAVLIFILSVFVAPAPGFSLRKRNVENKLNEALKVIERQKRHVLYDEADREWTPPDQNLYDWTSQYPEVVQNYEDTFDFPALRELYAERYLEDDDKPSPGAFDWNSLFGEEPQKELDDSASTPVSDQELDDIFNSTDDEENENIEDEGNEDEESEGNLEESIPATDKREYDPSQRDDKRGRENALTPEEVKELLSGAEGALDEALSEKPSEKSENTAVSDDELKDIFQDVDDEDDRTPLGDGDSVDVNDGVQSDESNHLIFVPDNNLEDNSAATNGERPQLADKNINKEWLINQYMGDGEIEKKALTKKKKVPTATLR